MKNKSLTAKILTYAGTLPFLFAGIGQFFIDDIFGIDLVTIATAYGAIIVSFVAGIHWGVFLFKDSPMNLFIHSNVIALLSWSSLLVPAIAGFFILAASFVYLILIDLTLKKKEIIEPWFFQIRLQATLIAIVTLTLNIFGLMV